MLGFYDSGVGGLGIFLEVQKALPDQKLVYLADSESCPLGEKSDLEIQEIVTLRVSEMFEKGVNLVVLACNTATATTVRFLQNVYLPQKYPSKKVLGIIKPITEEILTKKHFKNSRTLILGTPATIQSGFYQRELHKDGYLKVLGADFSGLAEAIEKDQKEEIRIIIRQNLNRFKNQLEDTEVVALACTHYPLVREIFQEEFRQLINLEPLFLDQTILVKDKLELYLKSHPEFYPENGESKIYTTGDPSLFEGKIRQVLNLKKEVWRW